MCITFHIKVVLFFGMLKKKSTYTKYLSTFTKLDGRPNKMCPKSVYRCPNGPKIPPVIPPIHPLSVEIRLIKFPPESWKRIEENGWLIYNKTLFLNIIKHYTFGDRLLILLLKSSEFKWIKTFWRLQKKMGFLMISGGKEFN